MANYTFYKTCDHYLNKSSIVLLTRTGALQLLKCLCRPI